MTINDTCICGAEFQCTGNIDTMVMRHHNEWLHAHKACREKSVSIPEPTQDQIPYVPPQVFPQPPFETPVAPGDWPAGPIVTYCQNGAKDGEDDE